VLTFANRGTCPLFDTGRSTRHIEAAYVGMWQAYRLGRPPASFAVEAGGLRIPRARVCRFGRRSQ
jgi:hypothetical protein